jgi:hypothetical protein
MHAIFLLGDSEHKSAVSDAAFLEVKEKNSTHQRFVHSFFLLS